MYFKQSTHQYIIQDKPYTSFSSIIKLVEPEKDWDDIAAKYAKKHSTKKEKADYSERQELTGKDGAELNTQPLLVRIIDCEQPNNTTDNTTDSNEHTQGV